MSHLIIQPYDVVYTPESDAIFGDMFKDTWHSLQTPVKGGIEKDGSNIPDVFYPVVCAGFRPDFDSPLADAPKELADELGKNPITGWKCMLADLRGRKDGQGQSLGVIPLHVAKEGYKVHQNKALFEAMVKAAKEVLGEKNFGIATVGTLGAYSQFFVSIAIKGQSEFTVGENDAWKRFFNLVSSHNGLVASQTLLSVIRIVCMNTVNAAIGDAETTGMNAAIKHTVNSESLITPQVFEANLKTWLSTCDQFKATMERIKGQSMTLDQFRAFASGVFTREDSDGLSTNSFNRVTDMESVFTRGKGNTGESVYDGVNAFTEYFTSGNGVGKGDKAKANISRRIASANFGRGNEWKLEAIRVASDETILTDTLKRGEVLYTDKIKEIASAN